MARRAYPNSLSPADSPSAPSFPRSTSPLAQFLAKPSRWFSRSTSVSSSSPTTAPEPRKHKISRPTDPRPILENYMANYRSVMDLSARLPGSLDIPADGTGDLRSISHRGWSKSVDDLSQLSPGHGAFKDKVAEYRNRSNSSGGGVVFPSSSEAPSSSSSPVSISISAPVITEPQQHTRSYSFTPKHPSKLSPAQGLRFPSSPKRKGLDTGSSLSSSSNAQQMRSSTFPFAVSIDTSLAPASATPLTPAQPTSPPNPTTTTTPTEPTPSTPKRASQIVFHTGFINQYTAKTSKAYKVEVKGSKLYFYKPPGDRGAGLKELFSRGGGEDECERGGEAEFEYECERDGADRCREGRREERKKRAYWGRGTHPELVRVESEGLGVRRGTFEALVHEVVFGTVFGEGGDEEPGGEPASDGEEHEDEDGSEHEHEHDPGAQTYTKYAHAILLSLPLLVGKPKFETEMRRCCELLVEGVDAGKEKQRVAWLVREYLELHGEECEEDEWEAWCEGLGVDFYFCVPAAADASISNANTTAAIADSDGAQVQGMESPNTDVFSPRPGTGLGAGTGMVFGALDGMVEAVGGFREANANTNSLPHPNSHPDLNPSSSSRSRSNSHPRPNSHLHIPWTRLETEGLTRDVLLSLDTQFLARSLVAFQRGVVERLRLRRRECGVRVLLGVQGKESGKEMEEEGDEVFGTEERLNWLTRIVIGMVLGVDGGGHQPHQHQQQQQQQHRQQQQQHTSSGRRSEDLLRPASAVPAPAPAPSAGSIHVSTSASAIPPSRSPAHLHAHAGRPDIIAAWARIGELCRLAGDECTFRAVEAGLTARPVARLDKAWRRVDRGAAGAVEGWVYPCSSGAGAGAVEPRVTVWGGDGRGRAREALRSAEVGGGREIEVEALREVWEVWEGCWTGFEGCVGGSVGAEEDEDVRRMVEFWKGVVESADSRFQRLVVFLFFIFYRWDSRMGVRRVEQFMLFSLAAEPRRKGLFEPHFWTRGQGQQQQLQPHMSLLPLLFPEPMPTVCLIDREKLLRGRVDSDASDTQLRRAMDPHRHPDLRALSADHNHNRGVSSNNLNWGGTVIPVYNGDLLLVVQVQAQTGGPDSAPSSRPSSFSRPPSSVLDSVSGTEKEKAQIGLGIGRTSSIRVKPGSSQGLERKTSVARRNSMPSITHRQNYLVSEPSSEPPLRVMVQAGTLNTLVGILVHGLQNVSVSVADDNGEMSLREGMTRELVVDRVEYAKVWWNVFRSFVNPLGFFELLRKLYITPQPIGSSPPVGEYIHVLTARTQVLDTIKEWLTFGGGAQDALDDIQLFNALQSFLDSPTDHVVYEAKNFTDPVVQQCKTRLIEVRESLLVLFHSQTRRPLATRGLPIPRGSIVNGNSARTRTLNMREPPDIDRFDAQEFVDNLDGMACAAFSNITEEDLYITADLLEIQFADRTAWFSTRETSTIEETVDIQNIYGHIQDVDHSPLISEMTQDSLYRLLPPGVRSCVRAYAIIRKWIIAKIVATRLGPRARQARMELLLRVIEIARWRNTNSGPGAAQSIFQPCVRSFVEAVTTSAILSVESRLHSRAWQNIALNRGVQCDSLAALLSRPSTQMAHNQEPLTPDMGWVLERILEVIADPDIVPSVSEEGQNLVNFDKRRHLCNLIAKAPALPSLQRRYQPDDLNRRGFERLNNVEREVIHLQFDHRGIKDEAIREAAQVPAPPGRRLSRPFQRIVIAQIEKNRRDKNLRARLQKEKLHEQSRQEKRDDLLNRAMRPRKPSQKQHRNKKSMSALFHFMRPISSAFGADLPPTVKKTAAELDFVPSGKPSLVLSLVDARVAQFINNERPFTFQLDTEDGGHYLLQAVNKRDMVKWIETISRVAMMAAKRRLTYLGPKPQLADHIHSHIVPSRDPKAMFGVELDFLLQREAGSEPVQPGAIPFVIEQCLSEVEARGLSEVGIYRIAGAVSEINALKDAFNRGDSPITSGTDIHAVCDLIKTWFRVLPEPVLPSSSYHEVIQAMQLDNLENRLEKIRNVVQGLPRANFDLLRRVVEHLDRVTDFEEQNHMTAEALAIVFSPNLLRAPQNDFSIILANMGHTHKLVKALITHFHVIFDDDADAEEADIHSEEYDSPIPEEDEEEDETGLHGPQTLETEQASSEADYSKHD
ncbi:hypothetical protein C0989_005739 [Termitomyces sp. Mn162]|nr:hypothetical protein C0989_005739 [Termitomyces sp. Mn162]